MLCMQQFTTSAAAILLVLSARRSDAVGLGFVLK